VNAIGLNWERERNATRAHRRQQYLDQLRRQYIAIDIDTDHDGVPDKCDKCKGKQHRAAAPQQRLAAAPHTLLMFFFLIFSFMV
jgi:hypothetical protein